jgi:predicted ATPase
MTPKSKAKTSSKMISTISIQSFKSIESLTIEIGQVNVFIGGNGS